jgi:hypothetical protein
VSGSSVALVKPTTSDPAPPGGLYLVERYLGAVAAEGLPAAVARLAEVCSASAPGASVRYLHSTYLPSEDTCFCLFRADSRDAVRRVNGLAEFAVDRITEAVVMFEADPSNTNEGTSHESHTY